MRCKSRPDYCGTIEKYQNDEISRPKCRHSLRHLILRCRRRLLCKMPRAWNDLGNHASFCTTPGNLLLFKSERLVLRNAINEIWFSKILEKIFWWGFFDSVGPTQWAEISGNGKRYKLAQTKMFMMPSLTRLILVALLQTGELIRSWYNFVRKCLAWNRCETFYDDFTINITKRRIYII